MGSARKFLNTTISALTTTMVCLGIAGGVFVFVGDVEVPDGVQERLTIDSSVDAEAPLEEQFPGGPVAPITSAN